MTSQSTCYSIICLFNIFCNLSWTYFHAGTYQFTTFLSSWFINPLMENLHKHHRRSRCRILTPSVVQSPAHLLPAPALVSQSPWPSSFCSCVPFPVFSRSFSAHTGRVLQVYVWVHFSLASCLATTQMGSESKYRDDIWCGLVHFG